MRRSVPRNRTARSAVLGFPVRRPAPRSLSSRSTSALKRRIVLGLLVLLALALITISFRESADGPLHDAQGAVASAIQPLEVGVERVARSFRVLPYDQPRGCVAAYYPEANALVPLDSTAEKSNQPVYKSIVVRLERPPAKTGSSTGSPDQGPGSLRTDHPHHLS